MKIGILTLPLHTNYGGILQAYALQTVLQRMGHEVVVIDKAQYRQLKLYKKPFVYTKRLIKKYIFRKNIRLFSEQYYNQTYPIVSQYTQQFIDKYINRIEVDDLTTLQEKDFDAIVVGSDQIWRPQYYPKIENAYLDFAKSWNIKRIAYAASFGTDKWEYTSKQTRCCAELLRKFNFVSVREDSGMKFCRERFGVEVEHVLDPTMLLDVEDYIGLIQDSNTSKSKGTLLNYILDETQEKKDLIAKIAKEKSLIPFSVNSNVENLTLPVEVRMKISVEQWLRGFHDAEFVITDSFHACVFSILFNKPFIVLGNKKRGMARFHSLLQIFGLEDRLIFDVDFKIGKVNKMIDWKNINILLDDKRCALKELLEEVMK